MKKLSFYIAAVACLAMAFSCKKDETTTTKPSMSGLSIDGGVAYIAKGGTQNYEIITSSLRSTGDALPDVIGLIVQITGEEPDTLTKDMKANPVKSFSYTAKDYGKYSVICYAYAPDGSHYSASASSTFQAIDPVNSLKGTAGSLVPGEKYLQTNIGGANWMAQNLGETGSGVPYEKCEILNSIFGRYYTYEEALTACPAGWHLPTAAEWDALGTDAGKLMVNATFLDDTLWKYSKEVKITNETGFNAIPTGYIDKTEYFGKNVGIKEYAAFWTADAKDAMMAHYRYIFVTNPTVQKGEGSRTSLALSVRCVK